jgi:hypothetical protein
VTLDLKDDDVGNTRMIRELLLHSDTVTLIYRMHKQRSALISPSPDIWKIRNLKIDIRAHWPQRFKRIEAITWGYTVLERKKSHNLVHCISYFRESLYIFYKVSALQVVS